MSANAPTETLATFAARLRFEDLPSAAVSMACNIILDALGCGIAAWRDDHEKANIAAGIARSFNAAPKAAIWGGGELTDAAMAALANGMLTNAADFDDTHKRALLHTGSVVVPPTLALAQERGLTGPDVVTAVVAGYEVAVRVGSL
jgi:2-methylcitrate dehydratase PrpD